jgi:hypothetical protein
MKTRGYTFKDGRMNDVREQGEIPGVLSSSGIQCPGELFLLKEWRA